MSVVISNGMMIDIEFKIVAVILGMPSGAVSQFCYPHIVPATATHCTL